MSEKINPSNTDLESDKNTMKKLVKHNKKAQITAIILAAVVLIALSSVIIYAKIIPEHKTAVFLELGSKYLNELNYEEALIAYQNIIEINPKCADAYIGAMQAHNGMNDYEKAIEILEQGFQTTKENQKIKNALIENYIIIAVVYKDNQEYEKFLHVYDRLTELEGEKGADIKTGLTDYINMLLKEKRFDEVKALIEKYSKSVEDIDFKQIFENTEKLEAEEKANVEFMSKVYNAMLTYGYQEMCNIYNSDEAKEFIDRMTEDRYIYFPEKTDTLTGVGAGAYKYDETEYYFYYGSYVEGIRDNYGSTFEGSSRDSSSYVVFSGEWADDAPNGNGKINTVSKTSNKQEKYTKNEKGKMVNGVWDGYVKGEVSFLGAVYDLSFTADNGIPTEDKTKEFLAAGGTRASIDDDKYVYAFGTKYGGWFAALSTPGHTVGVSGFAD